MPESPEPEVEMLDAVRERRILRMGIQPETMAALFVGDHIVRGNLPVGVQVCGAGFDHQRRAFDLIIAHPSFEPVPEGQVIPDIPPEMATVTVRSPKTDSSQ